MSTNEKYCVQHKCSIDGCQRISRSNGKCSRCNGYLTQEKKDCKTPNCPNLAQNGGKCGGCNGRVRKLCDYEGGCTNQAVKDGMCKRHGPRCEVPGCKGSISKAQRCWKHHDGSKCEVAGCTNFARSKGRCIQHGATQKRKRCGIDGCRSFAQRNQKCRKHIKKSEKV